MRSTLKRGSFRASEKEASGEGLRGSRTGRKQTGALEITPEEQAEQVKAHRLKMQAATTSIEESINALYQKKEVKEPRSPRSPVRHSDAKPMPSRLSLAAAGGDFFTVQEDLDNRPETAPEPVEAPKGPRRLISQRTSALGAREPPSQRSERRPDEEGEEAASPKSGDGGQGPDDEGGGDSDDSHISSEGWASDDSDLEDFDVVQSREKVNELLNGLNVNERVEVMDFLNTWFTDRSNRIGYESESLRRIEEERTRDYMEAETAVGNVGDKLEDTEKKTLKMMEEMHDSISKAPLKSKKVKQRPKTGVSDKEYQQLTAFNPDEDQNVQLEMAIEQLRAKLMEKEGEMRKAVQATGVEDEKTVQMENDDLIRSLNRSQDEINDLQRQVTHGENRVKLLKSALDHISIGGNDTNMPDKEVSDIIIEMRQKVHDGKITELMAKREVEYGEDLKRPDEHELEQLQEECENMKNKLSAMEEDIAKLRSPENLDKEIQDQLAAIKGGQQPKPGSILDEVVSAEIQPERSPEVKVKLHMELLKAQEEEDKLKKQLEHYQHLCESSQKTLKTMEDQRALFLESVTTARAVHWGTEKKESRKKNVNPEDEASQGFMIDKSVHDLFIHDESEDFSVDIINKQDEVMQKLREEEQKLEQKLKEISEQNDEVFAAIEVEKEKTKINQEELNDAQEKYRKAAYPDEVTPELIAQVAELNTQNRERLAEIRLQRQKLCGFPPKETKEDSTVSPKSPAKRANSSAPVVDEATDFEERIQAVRRAAEEQAVGAPMPVIDKASLSISMRAGTKPSEEELAQILAMQCSKDLRELLAVQAENTKLAKEVAALEEQIRRARLHKSQSGVPDASSLSHESARELRRKQRELNALRAQWRARERVRQEKEAEALLIEEDEAEMGIDGEEGEEEQDGLQPDSPIEDNERRSSRDSVASHDEADGQITAQSYQDLQEIM